MSNAIPGNQKLAWLPTAIPRSANWGQKLVALGRRLSELLRIEKSSGNREDDPMYFGM